MNKLILKSILLVSMALFKTNISAQDLIIDFDINGKNSTSLKIMIIATREAEIQMINNVIASFENMLYNEDPNNSLKIGVREENKLTLHQIVEMEKAMDEEFESLVNELGLNEARNTPRWKALCKLADKIREGTEDDICYLAEGLYLMKNLTKEAFEHTKTFKSAMIPVIQEWTDKCNRPNSLLLKWNRLETDEEITEFINSSIETVEELEEFCLEIIGFMKSILKICK